MIDFNDFPPEIIIIIVIIIILDFIAPIFANKLFKRINYQYNFNYQLELLLNWNSISKKIKKPQILKTVLELSY